MSIDLDMLTITPMSRGDYGVHDPIHAWPGSGADVVVNVRLAGNTVVMTGYNPDTPETQWARSRAPGGGWSEWAEAGVIPPPVDPGIPEAPIDGKTYGRKDGAWVEIVITPPA